MTAELSAQQKAAVYAKAIGESKPNCLSALRELCRLEVCARCCLRFAAVRTDVYRQPAPPVSLLCEAVAAQVKRDEGKESVPAATDPSAGAHACGGKQLETEAAAPISEVPAHSDRKDQSASLQTCVEPSDKKEGPLPLAQQTVVGQPSPSSSAAEPVCRVCLGVLQSLDGQLSPVPSEVLRELPDTDNCGAPWAALSDGSTLAIAEHIRGLDFHNESFAVELSVPASAQLRQLATWHHLRSLPATSQHFQGQSFRDDAVDLKESLRLRDVITEPLAGLLQKPHDPDKGDLKVTISYIHPATAHESDFLYGKPQGGRSKSRKRKRSAVTVADGRLLTSQKSNWKASGGFTGRSATESIANLAAALSIDELREFRSVPPPEERRPVHLLVSCRRVPQYIAGYYRKLQRDISQSPWVIDGAKKGRTSVQEEIEKVLLPPLRCDAAKFITAGREDIDVRMLGEGRPFVMEIQNQRAPTLPLSEFALMEKKLKESGVGVEVRKLQPVPKVKLQAIKEGEQHKQKSYEALCELSCEVTPEIVEKINGTKDLLLAQTTPTRVAHRRALLVRERTVYTLRCSLVDDNKCRLMLNLRTQAGTYVKEFVHGDEGRTTPNLGSLLGCKEPAKILSLDVLEVHMEFL